MLRITAVLAAAVGLAASQPATHSPVNEVKVTARDFAFDAPATVEAGVVKFTLLNQGPHIHHLMVVKLEGGHTMADVLEAAKHPGPIPDWFVMMGGPNAPNPGGTSNATLLLEPGNYILTCFVDDDTDHLPHIAKGMIRELKVVPESAPQKSSLAPADLTMKLADYSFTTTSDLKAGHHVLRVENDGPQAHEVEIIKLAPGKTPQDFVAWTQTMTGPPPASMVGGTAPLSTGHANNVDLDLTPGDYMLVCFVPDSSDGKPHFMHGMVRAISVK